MADSKILIDGNSINRHGRTVEAGFRGAGVSPAIFWSPHIAKTPAGRRRHISRCTQEKSHSACLRRLNAARVGCMFPVGQKVTMDILAGLHALMFLCARLARNKS